MGLFRGHPTTKTQRSTTWCPQDLAGGKRLVGEGRLEGRQVVGPDGNQGPPPANVLMQLVLGVELRWTTTF